MIIEFPQGIESRWRCTRSFFDGTDVDGRGVVLSDLCNLHAHSGTPRTRAQDDSVRKNSRCPESRPHFFRFGTPMRWLPPWVVEPVPEGVLRTLRGRSADRATAPPLVARLASKARAKGTS